MVKRALAILSASLVLVMAFVGSVRAAKTIGLVINGTRHSISSYTVDGRVMVPLEEVVGLLGGTYAWDAEEETAFINLPVHQSPQGNNLDDSCVINVTRITEGLSILAVAGEVTNVSSSVLQSVTVHGSLVDALGTELTRTYTYRLNPSDLQPGETGTFEIIFLDYDLYRENNKGYKYKIYVQGFPL